MIILRGDIAEPLLTGLAKAIGRALGYEMDGIDLGLSGFQWCLLILASSVVGTVFLLRARARVRGPNRPPRVTIWVSVAVSALLSSAMLLWLLGSALESKGVAK